MYLIIATLIVICSILLVLIILIQNPKGGGLSSTFGGGANQMMGVKNTTDFLERSTWTLAIALIVLILASNFAVKRDVNVPSTTQAEKGSIFQNNSKSDTI